MPLKLSAFPKCYLDQIAGDRTMTVFDWIEQAETLDADGLEMYDGFFTSLEPDYLDRVGEAIRAAGFAMPMLCCSPDFTNPDPTAENAPGPRGRDDPRLPSARRPEVRVPRPQRPALSGGEPRTGRGVGGRSHREAIAGRAGKRRRARDGEPLQGRLLEIPRIRPEKGRFSGDRQRDHRPTIFRGAIRSFQRYRGRRRPRRIAARVADRVVSMHASDRFLAAGTRWTSCAQTDGTIGYSPNLRHGVTGKGFNDYDAIFRILADHHYSGWVSIEDGMNGMDEMAESLAFLRMMSDKYFPGGLNASIADGRRRLRQGGRIHADALRSVPEAEFVAVCDSDAGRAGLRGKVRRPSLHGCRRIC